MSLLTAVLCVKNTSRNLRGIATYFFHKGFGRFYSYFWFNGAILNFALNIPNFGQNIKIDPSDQKLKKYFMEWNLPFSQKMQLDLNQGACLGACFAFLEKSLIHKEPIAGGFTQEIPEKGIFAQIAIESQHLALEEQLEKKKKNLLNHLENFRKSTTLTAEEISNFERDVYKSLAEMQLKIFSPVARSFGLQLDHFLRVSTKDLNSMNSMEFLPSGEFLVSMNPTKGRGKHAIVVKKVDRDHIFLFFPGMATYFYESEAVFLKDFKSMAYGFSSFLFFNCKPLV